MHKKWRNITKYFGFAVVGIEWLGVVLLMVFKQPDLSEPFSQYGYYDSTRITFGLLFTLAAATCYLFSTHLDAYWKHSSRVTFLAAIFFIITGWAPYTPAANAFILDAHNLAIVLAVLLYSTPMLFIGYKKAHKQISLVSRYLYYIMLFFVVVSLVARVFDIGVIYAQLASIVPFHIWLVTVNILLLRHHKEIAKGHTGKL